MFDNKHQFQHSTLCPNNMNRIFFFSSCMVKICNNEICCLIKLVKSSNNIINTFGNNLYKYLDQNKDGVISRSIFNLASMNQITVPQKLRESGYIFF